MRYTKEEVTEAREQLLAMLKPGSTVWTVVKHVARSGMSRHISCYVVQGADIRWIDGYVAKVTGYPFDREREALRVGGCGMDMGSQLVYSLSRTLYPDGFECLGERQGPGGSLCPSNDHSNGDRDYTPHNHEDGGYALNRRWL